MPHSWGVTINRQTKEATFKPIIVRKDFYETQTTNSSNRLNSSRPTNLPQTSNR